jgi:hypothetical protein
MYWKGLPKGMGKAKGRKGRLRAKTGAVSAVVLRLSKSSAMPQHNLCQKITKMQSKK